MRKALAWFTIAFTVVTLIGGFVYLHLEAWIWAQDSQTQAAAAGLSIGFGIAIGIVVATLVFIWAIQTIRGEDMW